MDPLSLAAVVVVLILALLGVAANTPQKGLSVGIYVDIAGTPTLVAGRTGLDISRTKGLIDATHAGGSGWAENLGGIRSWSADLGIVALVDTTTGSLSASQAALEDAFDNDTEVTVAWRRPGQTLGKQGQAIITAFNESSPHDGRYDVSVSLAGNGPLVAET